jgi:hypothetical protein
MLDVDIRKLVHARVRALDTSVHIIDELGINKAEVIADVVAVNGVLSGFEIKSDSDNLVRLQKQSEYYDRVFDFSTVVVVEKHLANTLKIVPDHWGILVANNDSLTEHRIILRNTNVKTRDLVELLWKDESVLLLRERNATKGLSGKTRDKVWDRVCEVYSHEDISETVRDLLKLGVRGRKLRLIELSPSTRFKRVKNKLERGTS